MQQAHKLSVTKIEIEIFNTDSDKYLKKCEIHSHNQVLTLNVHFVCIGSDLGEWDLWLDMHVYAIKDTLSLMLFIHTFLG